MSETRSPHLNLPWAGASDAQNEIYHFLDVVLQGSIISEYLSTPPVSPSEGDAYIVATGGTGAWAGKDNNVTAWYGGSWRFFTPNAGWTLWSVADQFLITYNSGAWTATPPTIPNNSIVFGKLATSGYVTSAQTIAANNVDTKLATAAAVKQYADSAVSGLGLGTMSTQNANAVNITGGSISGTALGTPASINLANGTNLPVGSVQGLNVTNLSIAVPSGTDGIDICQVTNSNFSTTVELWFTIHASGYAQSKRYTVPLAYNGTAGAWQKLYPLTTTGPYGGNDCDVDISITNQTASFRFRRVSGSTSGNATIGIMVGADPANTTITPTSSSYPSATWSGTYGPTAITQRGGNVGINNDNPQFALDVNGTINATAANIGAITTNTINGQAPIGEIFGSV